MRVLITGITGFVGSHMADYLLDNIKSEKKILDIVDQVLKTCEELDKQNSVKT